MQCNPECALKEYDYLSNVTKRKEWVLTDYMKKMCSTNYIPLYCVKPLHVGIIREEGSNGEREMAAAFSKAGFVVHDVTMYDLEKNPSMIDMFVGIVFVGGFSFADVCGAAQGWFSIIENNHDLSNKFEEFKNDPTKFSLGICNGCQLMSLLKWIPGNVKLLENTSGRFESRSSTVKIKDTNSLFFKNMDQSVLDIWVAHGEGKFTFDNVDDIPKDNVCIQYVNDKHEVSLEYPHNPNGSNISTAAICSDDGRHLAMMPHPERAYLKWQLPWIPEAVSYTHLTLPTSDLV